MLDRLERPRGAVKRRKIVGRGRGSGHGKTSGKGEKGQNARASGGVRPGFEGGQMPLIRRIPKRGFTFHPKAKFEIVAVGSLNRFPANAEVTPEALRAMRLITKGEMPVKILGDGELEHALKVNAHSFSGSAEEKIKKAGGTAHWIGRPEPKPSKESAKKAAKEKTKGKEA